MTEYQIEPWDSSNLQTNLNLDMYVPPEIDELALNVITHYDMEVSDKTLITSKPDKGGAIWKIQTDKGPRSLKLLHRKPIRSLFSVGAQDFVVKKGARVPGLITTKTGALYVEKGGKLWIVTDWIESLTPAGKDLKGAQELCLGLGEFHKHSQGYIPPKGAQKASRLAHWPTYYQEILTKISWFRNIAKAYEDIPSSRALLSLLNLFEHQALDAISLLEQSSYAQMVAMGEEHWGLVHQDYGWSNGQLGPGGLWVIDLDGVAYDLPIRDLRKLISSTMDDMGTWDLNWIRGMIDAYHQANPLDRETYEVLLIDFAFPNEFYKHIHEMLYDPVGFMNTDLEGILQHLILLEETKGSALKELHLDTKKLPSGNYNESIVSQPPVYEMQPTDLTLESTDLPSLPLQENPSFDLEEIQEDPYIHETSRIIKKNNQTTVERTFSLKKKRKKKAQCTKKTSLEEQDFRQQDSLLKYPVLQNVNSKLNILMICTEKLPVPPVRGGAIQTYIVGISGFLSQHHDLTILGTSDPSLPDDERSNNIRYVRVDGKHVFEIYAEEVIAFLKKNAFDLIHVFNRPRLIPLIREAAPDSRLILSMHNDMFNHDKITSQEALTAIHEVERIITVSNYVGNTISNLYPSASSKVHTIYSGVDLNTFIPWGKSNSAAQIRQRLRTEHNLQDKTVILFVGRLTPKKGIDLLVEALKAIHFDPSKIALVIVGGTWYSEDKMTDYVSYVRTLAEKAPFPVITTGYIPSDLIHEWFWAGDIFVCPSKWQEPLARVHYEAMAAGLPFLTTARGGNPEVVIEENGIIVEQPEDPFEFAEKLKILLSDPRLRQKMGQTGRRIAEERFSWERVANEVLDIWKSSFVDKPKGAASKVEHPDKVKNLDQQIENLVKPLVQPPVPYSSVVKITRDMIHP
ncbi:CotS family spore coat protein [Desulfitobacterium sp. AusDCA]|uniref:CotS family spore coat protein n=1 Tax=Desulfitobacterium sp. AusDCA TaxID=3240383 RepID=UPI003DA7219B